LDTGRNHLVCHITFGGAVQSELRMILHFERFDCV
jgi:hypothetical protein